MRLYVSKAVPVIERRRQVVAGWLCTVHAEFEGGTGFDELKFQVPPEQQRPLSDWTAAMVRDLLDAQCPTHEGFRRFAGVMAFRRDYDILPAVSLTELGEESHVYLTCPELSQ